MPSKTLNDLVFCKSLWNREGRVGICGTGASLYCGSEEDEDEDAEDMIGVMSPLQGDDSGRICEGAEISIVEWRGGLHLAFFRRKHVFPIFSISIRRTRCSREIVSIHSSKDRFSCLREGIKDTMILFGSKK